MPAGWMGPGGIESARTLDLLKEAGYRYVMDWPLDDQPVWLRTRSGPILCVPYPIELNDIGTNVLRHESAETFADMIVCQFEEMVRQCERAPLVMNVSLHPFIVGQPFRLWRLRQANGCGGLGPARSPPSASRCPPAPLPAARALLRIDPEFAHQIAPARTVHRNVVVEIAGAHARLGVDAQ